MIGCIAVSDGLEWKVSVETNKPSCKAEKKFGERRVHVEVILAVDIMWRELAEMDFIETRRRANQQGIKEGATGRDSHNLVWNVDLVKSQRKRDGRQHCYNNDTRVVRLQK